VVSVAEFLVERFNYAVVIVLMMIGLYIVFATGNLVKKLVGLSVFQTSVFLLYISVGKVAGGIPPILNLEHEVEDPSHVGEQGAAVAESHAEGPLTAPTPAPAGYGDDIPFPAGMTPDGTLDGVYSNPLPHVLILTAIVVGVATLAVGLALVVRIRETYGVIEEDDLHLADVEAERP
jgi:multicomponent Na+:H+ antiporter subunit C